jgi:bacterioferritin (cytochrome b1)
VAITTKEYIAALNDLASREMRMQLIYSMSAGMLTGPWRDSLSAQFSEHQEQEARHAEVAFRRIAALGGVVVPEFKMPPTWSSLDEMIDGIAKLEEDGIKAWINLLNKLDESDAFRYAVEDILAEESHHWDEAKRWQRTRQSSMKEDLHIHVPSDSMQVGGTDDSQQSDGQDPALGLDEPVSDLEPPPDGISLGETSQAVVGETRRLRVYGLHPNYLDNTPIGEAWQDEDGAVHGDGLCRTMLFEPFANMMYGSAASGLDTSPLAIFAFRLSMSPFVRVEWEDDDDAE